jgi:hypothetical protein
LSLCVYGNDLQIIEFGDYYTVKSFSSQHIISFLIEPWLPCLSEPSNQHLLSLSVVVVDIYWKALVVTHRTNDSSLGRPLNLLTLNDSKVKVIALGLLPDIVRGVITSPKDQIYIKLR